jgi:abequosyltransferase
MSIALSICIPTYNRADFLDEALASICALERADEIEIVVCDNASQDHTPEVVARWQARHPRLRSFRWDQNQGADRNFLKVVEMAAGEYCWLLGSDDRLADNALTELIPLLADTDILLLDYTLMSIGMDRVLAARRALDAAPGSRFAIKSAEDFRDYLARARELSGLFAYISTVVVRRAAWQAVPEREEFIGSAWIHVTKLLDLFRKGATLTYVGKPLVLNRSGNDSFLAEVGYTRRTLIDLDYVRICQRVFADQPDLRACFMARLEHWFFSWHAVLGTKHAIARSDGASGLAMMGPALFAAFPESRQRWLKQLAWRMTPLSLLSLARSVDRWRRGLRSGTALP